MKLGCVVSTPDVARGPLALLSGTDGLALAHPDPAIAAAAMARAQGIVQLAGALRDMGYDGYLSAELRPLPDPDTAARWTAEEMRKYL